MRSADVLETLLAFFVLASVHINSQYDPVPLADTVWLMHSMQVIVSQVRSPAASSAAAFFCTIVDVIALVLEVRRSGVDVTSEQVVDDSRTTWAMLQVGVLVGCIFINMVRWYLDTEQDEERHPSRFAAPTRPVETLSIRKQPPASGGADPGGATHRPSATTFTYGTRSSM